MGEIPVFVIEFYIIESWGVLVGRMRWDGPVLSLDCRTRDRFATGPFVN